MEEYIRNGMVRAAKALGIPEDIMESSYMGYFDSDEDFAYEIAKNMGHNLSSWPFPSINWEHAAQNLMSDHMAFDGHYFLK